jgi:hypothetical protein
MGAAASVLSSAAAAAPYSLAPLQTTQIPPEVLVQFVGALNALQQQPQMMPQRPSLVAPVINPAMLSPSALPPVNAVVDPVTNLIVQALAPFLLQQQQQNQPQHQPSRTINQPFALQQPNHQFQYQSYAPPYAALLQSQQPLGLPFRQQESTLPHFLLQGQQHGQLQQLQQVHQQPQQQQQLNQVAGLQQAALLGAIQQGSTMSHFPLQGQQQGQLQQFAQVQQQPQQQQQVNNEVAELQHAALLGAIQQALSGRQPFLITHQEAAGMPVAAINADPLNHLNFIRLAGQPTTALMLPLNGTIQMQHPNDSTSNASTLNREDHGQKDPPADIP